MEVISSLGIDRFPTHSEIENFYGDKALTVKISRTGGTKYWADTLGYGVKQCESEFGTFYEEYAINDILEHTGLESYKNKIKYPYDITTNKHIKVDVKASMVTKNNKGYIFHRFNLEKKEPTCDIYLLYCINKNNDIYKKYIIPSCVLYGIGYIGISSNGISKYDRYKDKWEIFSTYKDFYNKILRN